MSDANPSDLALRLQAEVHELKRSVEAERLARLTLESRFDDLLERFEHLAREHDAQSSLGTLRAGGGAQTSAKQSSAPSSAPDEASSALANLAIAHAQYLREEEAPVGAHVPEEGQVNAGDESYWAAHRQASWQGEVRDKGGGFPQDESVRPRRVAAATEDEYWSQHF